LDNYFLELPYVFGRDDGYWYRLSTQLGRSEIVSTTFQQFSFWRLVTMLCVVTQRQTLCGEALGTQSV